MEKDNDIMTPKDSFVDAVSPSPEMSYELAENTKPQQQPVELTEALNKIMSVIEQQLMHAGDLSNIDEKAASFNNVAELLTVASDVSKAIANPALAATINMTAIATIINDEKQDISPAEKDAKRRMDYIATLVELDEAAEMKAEKEAANNINELPSELQQIFIPEIQQAQQRATSEEMRVELAALLDTSTTLNADISKLAISTAFGALTPEHQQIIADTLGVDIGNISEQALISRLDRLQSEGMLSVESLCQAHEHCHAISGQENLAVLANELLAYEALNLNVQLTNSILQEHITQLQTDMQQYVNNEQNASSHQSSLTNPQQLAQQPIDAITIPDAISPKQMQHLHNASAMEPQLTLQSGQANELALEGRLADLPQLSLSGANSSGG
jgi:hypothetical protein